MIGTLFQKWDINQGQEVRCLFSAYMKIQVYHKNSDVKMAINYPIIEEDSIWLLITRYLGDISRNPRLTIILHTFIRVIMYL